MDEKHDREPVPLFITPREIEMLERLVATLKAMDRIRLQPPDQRKPAKGFVIPDFNPCTVLGVIQICDVKIVGHPSKEGACRIEVSQTPFHVEGGHFFCLCNDTDWDIRVEFLKSDGSGSCTAIEVDDRVIELAPGASRRIDASSEITGTCECYLKISRKEDGDWKTCSGSGGSPELIVDPPSGP